MAGSFQTWGQKEQENHGWLYNTDNTTADDEDQEDEGPVTRLERWQRRLLSWKYEMLIATRCWEASIFLAKGWLVGWQS